jgi:hypothetical protein
MIIRHVRARTLKPLLIRLRLLIHCVTMSDSLSDIAARKQEKDAVRYFDCCCAP